MSLSHRFARIIVAGSAVAGITTLWAASIVHWGDLASGPDAIVADAREHGSAMFAAALLNFASMIAFLVMAVGLAAMVRGRGRTFTVIAATLFAIGCPSHVIGGMGELITSRLVEAGMPHSAQVQAVESLSDLSGLYFLWIVPFLIGMVLVLAAMWRARVVSWGPLALLLADLLVIGRFTGDTSPSEPLWYVDVLVTVAAFVWLAVGIVRYRPTAEVTPAENGSPASITAGNAVEGGRELIPST